MDTLVLFLPACFALNMIPGPNNLLSMSNAQRFGFKCALGAGLGRILAFIVMIFLTATGLATILHTSETLFLLIKTIGAFYLFWVAFKLWYSKVEEVQQKVDNKSAFFQLAKQEFLLAAGNPKAILIFTAFLPQFIDPAQKADFQFFVLGSVFIVLEFLAVAIYASFGRYLKHWFSKPKMRKTFNCVCATFIGTVGIGILFERKI